MTTQNNIPMKINKIFLIFLFIINQVSAQTYYGYQKQEAPPVDYSQVARDLNGAINDAIQNRENRKAELENISTNSINTVSSLNVISDKPIVKYLCLSFQQSAINELEIYNRLLKQGLLDPSQFNYLNNNCVSQYYKANNYCNQLDLKLSLIDANSNNNGATIKTLTDYVNNSDIRFYTDYRETRRYAMIMSQLYSITVNGTDKMGLDYYFGNLNKIIMRTATETAPTDKPAGSGDATETTPSAPKRPITKYEGDVWPPPAKPKK